MHLVFFFFNDTATTEIYTHSLHDALPIWRTGSSGSSESTPTGSPRPSTALHTRRRRQNNTARRFCGQMRSARSEEHTSELQLRQYLVCRLLLEKKKTSDRH